MVERRNVISGGLIAGLVGALTPSAGAASAAAPGAAGAAAAGGGMDDNTPVLRKMLEELEFHRPTYAPVYCSGLVTIRAQQHTFLKAQGRYPEYIEIGLGIWDQVYDWHIRYQVPLQVSRLPDGAYVMPYMFTSLVLRPTLSADYVGSGYDGR